ncbi:hypothetical protein [Halomonas urumqiensis]|uniref:Phage tail tape measure protein n=1 Tax=Halomonas urumqiensis TaxID=1684789 RepID=A0A2N7UDQ4_9GAMM|nr:hypothetical protein [Halomonas urumqiensis]PMR78521.1 hypothetical protein C1H70_17415 [Halomonas urumqiensis]PTB03666.1 hypothetical protein C6V82_04045 [Halomonas urumqiensis]GHE20123.1 hypothetical protein GCM10017767_06440 [Halomonas urumqiensis]
MAKDLNLSVTLKAINKATGPLKKILQGSRGVGRAMRETRGELKDFNDQQKRIQAFRDITRQSHATRDALREKRAELDRVSQEIDATTGPTKRLTNQQAKTQAAVDKLNREYRDQRERVRELAKGLPRATDGTRGLSQQQAALERKIRATTERLNAQRNALQRLSDADVSGRFNRMTGEIGRLGRRAVVAGGAAAAGIFGIANSTAGLGDNVAKSADKMGIGIGALQELRYAAERSGVSSQKLDSSTERFVKRLGEARQGSGAAAKAYEQLGLDANQLAELTPDAALGVVADRLAQVESHTDKVALAAQFFGREGVAMVNMLKDGSSGLEALRKDARATGYVLSDEAARDAEVFKDAMLDAELGMAGMKNTIGAELMPAITELMGDLSGWMRENRDQVKQFAKSFGNNLKAAVPIITDLAKGTARLATGIGEVVSKLAGMVGGYENLAMIAGGLFASKALLSVVSFGVGIVKAGGALLAFAKTLPAVATGVKALSVAFAATPIGWIVAGIAAVAAGALYLWKHWETIGPRFAALWESLKADAGAAWEWFKAAPRAALEAVKAMLADWDLKGMLKEKWDQAIDYLKNLPGRMKDAGIDLAKGLGDGIKNGAGNAWGAVKELATGTEHRARYELDTHSPSRVFRNIGHDVTDGLSLGIRRHRDDPASETRHMVKRLRDAGGGLVLGAAAMAGAASADADPLGGPRFDTRPALSSPSGGGLTLNGGIHISVQATPGMDEQALARYVAAEVQRALATAERDATARQRSAFYDVD